MPAHSDEFPWPSYYGNFNFFEDRMAKHGEVSSITPLGDGLYELARNDGQILRVFICECYSFGVAEYEETKDKVGALHAVVINSSWCGYSSEVKRYCRDREVGVFKIAGLMAALNRPDFWNYLDESEKERFKNKGWL